MQTILLLEKKQLQSQIMITLHRQIEALSPIKISYENLSKYYEKVKLDFKSLAEEHEYALTSLKASIHNLVTIQSRTEDQKNMLIQKIKDMKDENEKIIIDSQNLAQKYELLGQQIRHEQAKGEQGLSMSPQFQKIRLSILTHIQGVQQMVEGLIAQQTELRIHQQQIKRQINVLTCKKMKEQAKKDDLKHTIQKINIECSVLEQTNKNLDGEQNQAQENVMNAIKANRAQQQKIIQQSSKIQSIKNQLDYKYKLLKTQKIAQGQFEIHQVRLVQTMGDLDIQKQYIEKESKSIQQQITTMTSEKLRLKQAWARAEQHLSEIKQMNELLLNKMQKYCQQDQGVQNVLYKKMTVLDGFAKRLARRYEDDHLNVMILRERNWDDKKRGKQEQWKKTNQSWNVKDKCQIEC